MAIDRDCRQAGMPADIQLTTQWPAVTGFDYRDESDCGSGARKHADKSCRSSQS